MSHASCKLLIKTRYYSTNVNSGFGADLVHWNVIVWVPLDPS